MKNSIFALILLSLVVLTSCVNQTELTESDNSYIFTSEDINELDLSGYEIEPLKNGKTYFFSKDKKV